MVCFQTKNPMWENFGGSRNGKFWYILLPFGIFYYHLVYFTAFENILSPFGIFCGHLVYFCRLGILHQEKSGNPGPSLKSKLCFAARKV
jgi:hypothetical protein